MSDNGIVVVGLCASALLGACALLTLAGGMLWRSFNLSDPVELRKIEITCAVAGFILIVSTAVFALLNGFTYVCDFLTHEGRPVPLPSGPTANLTNTPGQPADVADMGRRH
jgi:hypothetical protein